MRLAEQTVALFSPVGRTSSPRPPLGMMYIASYLEGKGYKTELIDIKGNESVKKVEDKIMRELKRIDPDVIGTTCDTPEVASIKSFSARIKKEINPEVKIVLGGSHPTFMQQDLLYRKSPIDYCILNEGESAFYELVKSVRKEKPAKNLNNLAFFDGKKIVRTPFKATIEDLDELPFPAYDKIDMDYYLKPDLWIIRGIPLVGFFVFTSRGCPFNCYFCVNKNKSNRKVRFRSPENVGEELQLLKDKYKIDGLYFYDDTFTVNRRHVEGICKEITQRKLDFIWGCETRVNLLDDNILGTMSNAGCVQIDFGVESGSDRLLKLMNKGITSQEVRDCFKLCKRHGIRTFANVMVNLPTETEEDLQKTISLAREINATVTIWNVCTPYPGTDLFDEMKRGLPEKDYYKLNPRSGHFDEWIDFIQKNYVFSEHKRDIKKLIEELHSEFPSIHNLSLKNPKAALSLMKNLSFLFSPAYIRTMAKSSMKKKYLEWWLRVGGTIKSQSGGLS